MRDTGLKDDYGTPIKDGDTIEWSRVVHGSYIKIGGVDTLVTGNVVPCTVTETVKTTKKMIYEVRGEVAGYFLDRPKPFDIPMRLFRPEDEPKCKVISN